MQSGATRRAGAESATRDDVHTYGFRPALPTHTSQQVTEKPAGANRNVRDDTANILWETQERNPNI